MRHSKFKCIIFRYKIYVIYIHIYICTEISFSKKMDEMCKTLLEKYRSKECFVL